MTTFAERLRSIRSKRNLSQATLARSCGLSQSAIANYENGTRKTTKDIFGMAEALAVNPMWLATGSGPMDPLPVNSDTPTAYHLNESSSSRPTWPFSKISPEKYWTLTKEQREALENTALLMMKS
ncbi:helix-turn-helix domain-containing protein [Pollutimonas bauzanensis]|uniref:helix-turn-helix domain-containing protein n=1 Tax=Pollutimonas bauzanensis TaxID=658167 RepID=UPI00333E5EA3